SDQTTITKAMVNLGDHRVQTIVRRGYNRDVRVATGRIATTSIIRSPSGKVWCRPRIARQQCCSNRTHRAAASDNAGHIRGNLCWIGHTSQGNYSHPLPLPLVIQVEEGLVFDDWAAQRSAELIVVEL